jgi:hypothetical protein
MPPTSVPPIDAAAGSVATAAAVATRAALGGGGTAPPKGGESGTRGVLGAVPVPVEPRLPPTMTDQRGEARQRVTLKPKEQLSLAHSAEAAGAPAPALRSATAATALAALPAVPSEGAAGGRDATGGGGDGRSSSRSSSGGGGGDDDASGGGSNAGAPGGKVGHTVVSAIADSAHHFTRMMTFSRGGGSKVAATAEDDRAGGPPGPGSGSGPASGPSSDGRDRFGGGGAAADGADDSNIGQDLAAFAHMEDAKVVVISEIYIHPHGRFRQRWDIASVFFIFYGALVIPFQVCFSPHSESAAMFALDRVIDLFFVFDVGLNFRTAEIVNGAVTFESRATAQAYLKSWFVVDFIAAFPWWAMPSGSGAGGDGGSSHRTMKVAQMGKMLKLMRLVRLLRMFRLTRIILRLEYSLTIRAGVSSIVRFMVTVAISSHWFACVFYVLNDDAVGNAWMLTDGGIVEGRDTAISDRYISAFYWAIMTMSTVGFGDVVPQSTMGRFFAIFVMIFGAGVFAFGITNVVRIVGSLNAAEAAFREKMDTINAYMNARELPPELRAEIREYMMRCERSVEHKLGAEQSILGGLSTLLRAKVAVAINDQFLHAMPFFAGLEPSFVMELALSMRTMVFMPFEDVVTEGSFGDEMYFIFHGAVEVLSGRKQLVVLGKDQYFGESAILRHGTQRTATVRTLDYTELRSISHDDFVESLIGFPATQDSILAMAKLQLRMGKGKGGGSGSLSKFSDTSSFARLPLIEAAATSTLVDTIHGLRADREEQRRRSITAASGGRSASNRSLTKAGSGTALHTLEEEEEEEGEEDGGRRQSSDTVRGSGGGGGSSTGSTAAASSSLTDDCESRGRAGCVAVAGAGDGGEGGSGAISLERAAAKLEELAEVQLRAIAQLDALRQHIEGGSGECCCCCGGGKRPSSSGCATPSRKAMLQRLIRQTDIAPLRTPTVGQAPGPSFDTL